MIRIASLLLAAVAASLSGSVSIAADPWKLQPLKYNNPGLTTDLGVGLWAWPLPMDYDDDGDYDLVVSCPDKPSNGFYFFENRSADPKTAMPVFQPGVHVGATGHNAQISYVEGQPRVLRENHEYVGFKKNGFGQRKKIYPRNKIHPGKTRANMWRYVDWEGDGDQDIVVGVGDWNDYEWDHAFNAQGRWKNGPLHGWVYLIVNVDGEYSKNPARIRAGGSPIDVYGWPSPNFADFDGDHDLDLLCGEFLDGFTYFENEGSRSEPSYAAGVKLKGADGKPLAMHLQMVTPTAIDWDRDGDLDLVVGDEDGRVAWIENTGGAAAGAPEFKQPKYFKQQSDELKFGALATPFAHDWDGDGDEDLLCGNTAGSIALFRNLDGQGTQWSAPELLEVDGRIFRILAGENGSVQGPAEAKWGYTTLSVADWDGDGLDDLLVNSILGEVQLLRRTAEGLTEIRNPIVPAVGTDWRTTPLAADFDSDGKLDLVLMDDDGFLTCSGERLFLDEDLQPVRLNPQSAGRSGRVKLALVDWDGDGRMDVLTNSENATWWRNCKDAGDGRVILKKVGNLARRNVAGHTSSPAVCDFDKDGRPDLLVGSENGRIYFIRHDDCVTFTEEEVTARTPREAIAPRFPGLMSETFVFTEASHEECYASTLVETSRGIVAAWSGGTREKHADVEIWSSYHDGGGWSMPRRWADGVQHVTLRYPCWNPVLYQEPADGPVSLYFKVGASPREWWGVVMTSYDRGRSFRDRRRLPQGIDGPARSKPLLLADGSLLCPSSTELDGDWRIHFEKKGPKGEWSRHEPAKQAFQVTQPSLIRHPDGRIQAFCRSKGGVVVTSTSADGGETWSPLKKSGLPGDNAGLETLTLRDGRHLLLSNHLDNGRHAIHLAISEDGSEWRAVAVVEQMAEGEFPYPAMIQADDGLVHVTYTWKRQRVRHVVIDPAQLKAGAVVNQKTRPE